MKKGMMIREVVEAANLKERIDEQASIVWGSGSSIIIM